MSASDAAPLPRLGEVFFDVRGSSRSMRLSWYADTGVAVFSIWQGGMCTGTFRLPIGDLPRMVEILQRGPQGIAHPAAEHGTGRGGPGSAYASQQDFPTGSVLGPGADGGYSGDPRSGYGREGYDREAYGREGYAAPAAAGYGSEELAGPRQAAYGRDELAEARHAAYRRDALAAPGQGGDARRDEFGGTGGTYGRDAFSEGPYPGYRTEPAADTARTGHGRDDSADTMAAGYGQDRFVPPYVRGPADEYGNDIPASGADLPTGSRRGAYRDEGLASRSGAEEYLEPQWGPADNSDGPRYRLRADGTGSPGGQAMPHSAGRHGGYRPAEPEQADPGTWP